MERSRDATESLAALRAGRAWGEVLLVPEVGSTNAEVVDLGADWSAVVAERQTQGRGRRGRTWSDAEGHGIACSVLAPLEVRGGPAEVGLGWVPLATGLAVRDCLSALGVDAGLKWPNDVLVTTPAGERKICGILCEVAPRRGPGPDGPRVVVGVGINLTHTEAELPVPTATSLRILAEEAGRPVPSRAEVVPALLDALRDGLDPVDLTSLRQDYGQACTTLGREVAVHLPDGTLLRGRAEGVAQDGRLRVSTADGGSVTVSAGDVQHVRHQP